MKISMFSTIVTGFILSMLIAAAISYYTGLRGNPELAAKTIHPIINSWNNIKGIFADR